jgi:hypothetical protein
MTTTSSPTLVKKVNVKDKHGGDHHKPQTLLCKTIMKRVAKQLLKNKMKTNKKK